MPAAIALPAEFPRGVGERHSIEPWIAGNDAELREHLDALGVEADERSVLRADRREARGQGRCTGHQLCVAADYVECTFGVESQLGQERLDGVLVASYEHALTFDNCDQLTLIRWLRVGVRRCGHSGLSGDNDVPHPARGCGTSNSGCKFERGDADEASRTDSLASIDYRSTF